MTEVPYLIAMIYFIIQFFFDNLDTISVFNNEFLDIFNKTYLLDMMDVFGIFNICYVLLINYKKLFIYI